MFSNGTHYPTAASFATADSFFPGGPWSGAGRSHAAEMAAAEARKRNFDQMAPVLPQRGTNDMQKYMWAAVYHMMRDSSPSGNYISTKVCEVRTIVTYKL